MFYPGTDGPPISRFVPRPFMSETPQTPNTLNSWKVNFIHASMGFLNNHSGSDFGTNPKEVFLLGFRLRGTEVVIRSKGSSIEPKEEKVRGGSRRLRRKRLSF